MSLYHTRYSFQLLRAGPLRLVGVIVFCIILFFFNDTATTVIYTLSLHDALPVSATSPCKALARPQSGTPWTTPRDRKSTRLNSSHTVISYAVFCLKKKKKTN